MVEKRYLAVGIEECERGALKGKKGRWGERRNSSMREGVQLL